jgi:hypothetical protein
MAGNFVIIERDADNKKFHIRVIDSAGAAVGSWGDVSLVLGQDPGTTPANPGTTMGLEIKLRETKGCDADGVDQFCMVLRSPWYATAKTSNPET